MGGVEEDAEEHATGEAVGTTVSVEEDAVEAAAATSGHGLTATGSGGGDLRATRSCSQKVLLVGRKKNSTRMPDLDAIVFLLSLPSSSLPLYISSSLPPFLPFSSRQAAGSGGHELTAAGYVEEG
ncbi:hypothetical protein E2562_030162 [Oryza meyeriana var. granulata]|uniref:Uncharacterized protein n=1 Tax=Oryza meyeriana var. granulata TaxID=110450 RepID=A0A6G1BPI3_9ORYZ|nr:hypothetical protein E2562_030162 [Oryza meyeriana var. granulata]